MTPARLQRFWHVAMQRTRYLTVVLENLYQDHNISAVLRTCEGLGIQDVHVVETTNAFRVNEEVALGASKWLTIYRYGNVPEGPSPMRLCLESLRQRGYRITATVPRPDALPVEACPSDRPLALLMGTEMQGLSEEAIRSADLMLYLPMRGFTESFNVSVSTAIFLYALWNKIYADRNLMWLSEGEQEALVAEWLKLSVRRAETILSMGEGDKGREAATG